MKPSENERRLDEAIKRTAPGPRPVPRFSQWQQAHPKAVEALKTGPGRAAPAWTLMRLLDSRMARIAAVLALTLGLGFAIGRLSSARRVDTQRLAAQLETSVLAAVDQRLQAAFEERSGRLKEEMARQIRTDLARFATQTLAIQDQKINDLTQSIAAVRSVDRQRIVSALEQIEMNHRAQLAGGLQALALQGSQTASRPSN